MMYPGHWAIGYDNRPAALEAEGLSYSSTYELNAHNGLISWQISFSASVTRLISPKGEKVTKKIQS